MKNLLKWVKILKNRCISRIKIRTIRTIWKKIRTICTILGLQNKKSVQSVHFGHPVYCSVKYCCSNSSIPEVILHSIMKSIKKPNHPAYHLSTLWPLEVWVHAKIAIPNSQKSLKSFLWSSMNYIWMLIIRNLALYYKLIFSVYHQISIEIHKFPFPSMPYCLGVS